MTACQKYRSAVQQILIAGLFFFSTADVLNAQLYRVQQCPPGRRIITLHNIVSNYFGNDTLYRLRLLDSAKAWAKKQNDDALYLHAQLQYFKVLADRQPGQAGAANILLSNETYFLKNPESETAGAYYLAAGEIYYKFYNFEKAFHFLLKAENIFNDVGYAHLALAPVYASNLMGFYLHFEDYKTALEYAKLTIQYSDTLLNDKVFALNNMGFIYLQLKDYDNAEKTFLQTIALAKATGHRDYIGIASGNYGNTLRLKGQYTASLPYLYTDVSLNYKQVPENSAITCVYIANSLLHLDSIAKALYYLDYSLTLKPDWLWSSFGINYYETKALFYKKSGDFKTASLYQDTLMHLRDSLHRLFDDKVLMTTSLKAKEEKSLAMKKKAELEAKEIKTVRNFIILILTIVFAIVLVFINQKRQNEKRRQKAKEKEAAGKLELANEKLQQYINSIKEKNSFIEKIKQELTTFQALHTDTTSAQEHLDKLHQAVILTDEDWNIFKNLCEQVWPGQFQRLNNRYAGLNRSEERLLALGKLNISSKEMAGMIGISVDSLRKARYRLRKKYPELADDMEFGNFL